MLLLQIFRMFRSILKFLLGSTFPSVPLIEPSMVAVVPLRWPLITASCYTVVRSVVPSSSLAVHATRLIEKDCNSCLPQGSVTCRSKRLHSVLQHTTGGGGWASVCRAQVSLCLSYVSSHHSRCCISRLNLILRLLMRRRWSSALWLRHRAASVSLVI